MKRYLHWRFWLCSLLLGVFTALINTFVAIDWKIWVVGGVAFFLGRIDVIVGNTRDT